MKTEAVIVINPGSTSTKIALFTRSKVLFQENITHPQHEVDRYGMICDQVDYRLTAIGTLLQTKITERNLKIVGIVGRGGIVKPLTGGTYRINDAFLHDAQQGTYGEHASNLGCLIAKQLKSDYGIDQIYTVDPVSVGNMTPRAELSGVPEIKRVGRGHPLNMKMTARKIALVQNIPFKDSNYIIAHLGGGISIAHVKNGKLLDINDALLGMGPFSPNRAGALPLRGLMKLCYTMPESELISKLSKNSGLKAYLGTEDLREVISLIETGDTKAKLVYEAFVYQIAKEIGAYFAASKAMAQAIIITGGIAFNEKFVADLKEYVGNLTEYHVFPGENEMEALAEGIFRIIDEKEKPIEY